MPPDLLQTLEAADRAGEQAFAEAVATVKAGSGSYSGRYHPGGEGEAVFVKRYGAQSGLARLVASLSLSRPYRVYRVAACLAKDNLVPAPLGLVCNRHSKNVYYFSECIEGPHLAELVSRYRASALQIDDIMRAMGRHLAAFHRDGWVHGDFKWTNIIVVGGDSDPAGRIYFIDLDAATPLTRPWADRGRDLARFLVNGEDNGLDTEELRAFLRAYADGMSEPLAKTVSVAEPALHKLRRRHHQKYGLAPAERDYANGKTCE